MSHISSDLAAALSVRLSAITAALESAETDSPPTLEERRAAIIDAPGTPGALMAAMLADSPALLYRMGEDDVGTAVARDDSEHAAHGAYTGAVGKGLPTPLDAGAARGVRFPSGSSGFLTSPAIAALGPTVTVEAWVRPSDHNSDHEIARHVGGSGARLIFRLHNSGAGFTLQVLNTNGQLIAESGEVMTSRLDWHQVALTISGSSASAKLYIDGHELPASASTQPLVAHTTFRFGAGYTASGMAFSHCAIYPTALSSERILDHYQAAALDYRPAPFLLGVHSDLTYTGPTSQDHAIKLAADEALGVQVARVSIPWYAIEPTQGNRNWAQTDAAIDDLVASGITVVGVLLSSPQWVNGNADRWYVPQGAAQAPWNAAQADWAGDVVERYSDRIGHWEIGNEQNQPDFWKPAPSAVAYKALYDAVRPAILAADPAARVSVGGIVGISASSGIQGDAFLRSLCDAGIEIDALSIHPYGTCPGHTNFGSSFDDALRIIETLWEKGHEDADVWITEWGWPTNAVSQAQQAANLDASLVGIRDRLSRFVSMAAYFIDVDGGSYTHGLYTSAGAAKQAAAVFAAHAQESL